MGTEILVLTEDGGLHSMDSAVQRAAVLNQMLKNGTPEADAYVTLSSLFLKEIKVQRDDGDRVWRVSHPRREALVKDYEGVEEMLRTWLTDWWRGDGDEAAFAHRHLSVRDALVGGFLVAWEAAHRGAFDRYVAK